MPRKKPYSGKQKKQQLKEKRTKKGSSDHHLTKSKWQKSATNSEDSAREETSLNSSLKVQTAENTSKYNPERYRLNFRLESRSEIERRKHEAQTKPIQFVPENVLEANIKEIYQPGSELDMPKRPNWSYKMSKEQLESREASYFQKYLNEIYNKFGDQNLSYFEHNLETWRQLWRVLEMSDVVVMVTDVRHPVLHFSPALYEHVVVELKKPLILVLNKIDLVPACVVAAWTSYFKSLFPHLHVVWFTSFPSDTRRLNAKKQESLPKRLAPKKRIYTTQIGPKELLHICQSICGDKVDMSSWEDKIEQDLGKLGFSSNDTSPAHQASCGDGSDKHKTLTENQQALNYESGDGEIDTKKTEAFEDGKLTIGFVGHPNVGKSSLMNGLIGRKVVSTSVTPGHTKYFQTYFLTPTVKLCDSPGLVFPSLIDKQQQVLSGIYPVAQVREPYTPVGYLASRLNLVNILRLKHPSSDASEKWTPWDISEAWANQRNYKTAKAARPDVYRAANSILRMAVDGRLCMYMRPPKFAEEKGIWEQHENTVGLLTLRTTGHFHGNIACDSDGRPLYLEDFVGYSSESIADSNSMSGFSEDSDPEDYDTDDTDGNKTLDQDDFDVMENKFSALAMMDDE
uniref:Guanine nucleotide-binding protein-like 1 n=1 Tax=Phallusia mammillata TaxID=59560 RepID=A0A6F9DE08_9ASCI|nr:guanine nucleotide-binding protein-like 1 [Phallusia mammillata]